MTNEQRPDGLTEDEGIVMDNLVAAWNAFVELPLQHPSERRTFGALISRCQDLLAARIARRNFPDGWPTYNGLGVRRERCDDE